MSSNTIPNYPFVGKKDTDEAANEFVFKILIVGDVGTGKTWVQLSNKQ
jgi:GTPase SAR1 family protein